MRLHGRVEQHGRQGQPQQDERVSREEAGEGGQQVGDAEAAEGFERRRGGRRRSRRRGWRRLKIYGACNSWWSSRGGGGNRGGRGEGDEIVVIIGRGSLRHHMNARGFRESVSRRRTQRR